MNWVTGGVNGQRVFPCGRSRDLLLLEEVKAITGVVELVSRPRQGGAFEGNAPSTGTIV